LNNICFTFTKNVTALTLFWYKSPQKSRIRRLASFPNSEYKLKKKIEEDLGVKLPDEAELTDTIEPIYETFNLSEYEQNLIINK
jgi:hypothetical protein